jgi:DNA-directed RNA polymerase subunit L
MDTVYAFYNYNKVSVNNRHIKSSFEINNIPLALANSLRRAFSSIVPTVTFDDTWNEDESHRSIVIRKNTSALHNEFLSHRLCLVPLNMENTSSLKIKTVFRKKTGNRDYVFAEPEKVPIFHIKLKNDIENKHLRDKDGFLEVNSTHFQVEHPDNTNITDYIPLDPYTNYPIILNKLKSFVSNEDGEELDLTCYPRIGVGSIHSRYDPTGTVSFQYKIDETRVDSTFLKKLEYLNSERKRKGLEPYSDEEVKQLRRSFELLDKERVYFVNKANEPNVFEYSVESIGFLNPDQIVVDALHTTNLLLKDIQNSFLEIEIQSGKLNIETNRKLKLAETEGPQLGVSFHIKNENHTIGNMLTYYIRSNFAERDDNVLSYAGYRMNHPLIEEIEFVLIPNNSIDLVQEIRKISPVLPTEFKNITFANLKELPEQSLRELLAILIFVKSINLCINDIKGLLKEFGEISDVKEPSFIVEDDADYFNAFVNL